MEFDDLGPLPEVSIRDFGIMLAKKDLAAYIESLVSKYELSTPDLMLILSEYQITIVRAQAASFDERHKEEISG